MTHPPQPGGWPDPWSPQPPPAQPDPQTAPGAPQPGALPAQGQPDAGGSGYDQTTAAPTEPYGYPPGYPAYGYPGYGYPVAAQPNNGLAIASMIVSIVGFAGLCAYGQGGWLGAVGAILGHVARRRIRERGEGGDGMALAGIIVGWIATGLAVLATIAIVIFIVWAANHPSTFDGSTSD
ncbi:MAG TPA: DUF4190 domain-containing protein [Micromonosporaceae bacterium]|jgi:hypothetical protein